MTFFYVITIVSSLIIISLLLYILISKKIDSLKAPSDNESLAFLNQNIQNLEAKIGNRLDSAKDMMMQVGIEIGHMKQIGSDLKNVQDFLKSPKLRGNLGEQGLRQILSSGLPAKYFDVQYNFRTGATVDAIIHLDSGKIPIDSKFSLENFSNALKAQNDEEKAMYRKKWINDLKFHVNSISSKYILPSEGTSDFAIMYLPLETVYFEIVNNEPELFEYAASKQIIVTSPSTLFYYLRTLMLGLEGKRVTEISRQIIQMLKTTRTEFDKFGESISILSKHLNNAQKTLGSVNMKYDSISTHLDAVASLDKKQELIEKIDDVKNN